jgi:hypothetical protein
LTTYSTYKNILPVLARQRDVDKRYCGRGFVVRFRKSPSAPFFYLIEHQPKKKPGG